MAWIFNNRTGKLFHKNKEIATGYSGNKKGILNPRLQCTKDIGPIPTGKYSIGKPHNSKNTGSYVMNLIPIKHNACGRTTLQIHGDNKKMNKSASTGCIILPRDIRAKIYESGDHILIVQGPIWIEI